MWTKHIVAQSFSFSTTQYMKYYERPLLQSLNTCNPSCSSTTMFSEDDLEWPRIFHRLWLWNGLKTSPTVMLLCPSYPLPTPRCHYLYTIRDLINCTHTPTHTHKSIEKLIWNEVKCRYCAKGVHYWWMIPFSEARVPMISKK